MGAGGDLSSAKEMICQPVYAGVRDEVQEGEPASLGEDLRHLVSVTFISLCSPLENRSEDMDRTHPSFGSESGLQQFKIHHSNTAHNVGDGWIGGGWTGRGLLGPRKDVWRSQFEKCCFHVAFQPASLVYSAWEFEMKDNC